MSFERRQSQLEQQIVRIRGAREHVGSRLVMDLHCGDVAGIKRCRHVIALEHGKQIDERSFGVAAADPVESVNMTSYIYFMVLMRRRGK